MYLIGPPAVAPIRQTFDSRALPCPLATHPCRVPAVALALASSPQGTCMCDNDHGGAACEFSSAVDCTSNGRVRDDGSCVCMPGYTGNCSVWDCSGVYGVAVAESCNCNGAWKGDRCQCLSRAAIAVNCTACAEGANRRSNLFWCRVQLHHTAPWDTAPDHDCTRTACLAVFCVYFGGRHCKPRFRLLEQHGHQRQQCLRAVGLPRRIHRLQL